MRFWHFLRKESELSAVGIFAIAGIAGLSNALILAIVNAAAHAISEDEPDNRLLLLFVIAILAYVVAQRHLMSISTVEVEKVVKRIRVRLSRKIAAADLYSLEGLGRSQVYASVNRDTQTISQSTAPLMIACQSAVLVTFSLLYILYLSLAASILALAIVGIGVSVHLRRRKELVDDLQRSNEREEDFFDLLTHLLEGFKEVKLNPARGRSLQNHLVRIADSVADLKGRTGLQFANYFIFTQTLFYLLIGAMVFILPLFSQTYSEDVTKITTAILFIIGPLTGLVGAIPVFSTAGVAAAGIEGLEQTLDQCSEGQPSEGPGWIPQDFQEIEFRNVLFRYLDKSGKPLFTLGPVNLTIKQGELLFIVGGNGSGKSTLLKLMTALYNPVSGEILVDGEPLQPGDQNAFRQLFSSIFTDYHLFDRLYGMAEVSDREVDDLLRLMELQKKTEWTGSRFRNQELSTGQKKRLALIISLLEDKPIYIFDEWAADQDPSFREFFYKRILKNLQKKGHITDLLENGGKFERADRKKTIIVTTHDDRYFHLADRVLKMDYGKLVPFEG